MASGCSSGSPDDDATADDATADRPTLQEVLDDAVAELEVDGASVAVVDSAAAIAPMPSVASPTAVTPPSIETTRFAIASVTKMFTTVVALRLAERGVVDLDAEVDLPGLQDGATLRDLLGHTAGLPYESRAPGAVVDARRLRGGRRPHRRRADPAACFQYSDLGFVGAGLVLERAAGDSLQRPADERGARSPRPGAHDPRGAARHRRRRRAHRST